jgi:hypothetical protein
MPMEPRPLRKVRRGMGGRFMSGMVELLWGRMGGIYRIFVEW